VSPECHSHRQRSQRGSLARSRASTGRNETPGQASSAEVTLQSAVCILQSSPNSSLGRCLFLSGFIHKEMLQKETKVDHRNGIMQFEREGAGEQPSHTSAAGSEPEFVKV
jgi:hypothetical protein